MHLGCNIGRSLNSLSYNLNQFGKKLYSNLDLVDVYLDGVQPFSRITS